VIGHQKPPECMALIVMVYFYGLRFPVGNESFQQSAFSQYKTIKPKFQAEKKMVDFSFFYF